MLSSLENTENNSVETTNRDEMKKLKKDNLNYQRNYK